MGVTGQLLKASVKEEACKLAKIMIICHRCGNEYKAVGKRFVSVEEEVSSVMVVTLTIHKSEDCTCLLK